MKAFEKMAKREERKKEATQHKTPRRSTTDEDIQEPSEGEQKDVDCKETRVPTEEVGNRSVLLIPNLLPVHIMFTDIMLFSVFIGRDQGCHAWRNTENTTVPPRVSIKPCSHK